MEIRLLGPAVRVMVDGQAVDAGTLKERAILANLALSPGKVVPTRRLIENVWGHTATESVRSNLYPYITRIRNRIRAAGASIGLRSRSQGYALEIAGEAVDWHRMKLLRHRASELVKAGEDRSAVVLLSEALDLWEGEPLSEFEGAWTHGTRRSMYNVWQIVVELWAESCLRIGHYDDVIAYVSESAAEHPQNEKLAVVLMKALAGSGRRAEALDVHARLRGDLVKEGTRPCDATQEVFQRILEGRAEGPGLAMGGAVRSAKDAEQAENADRGADPAAEYGSSGRPPGGGARAGAGPEGASASTAAQAPASAFTRAAAAIASTSGAPAIDAPAASPRLPAAPVIDCLGRDIDDFTARADELAAILGRARSRPDTTTVIVISGLGGMGKSVLALRAAHLLREEFDIRLQLDLHGHTAGRVPLDSAQALHLLLRKLGVAGEDIPPEQEARAALWSSRLAGSRALVVLDDATRGRVAPLIPGTPGCVVLVTSRWTLAELDGVHHVTLIAPDADAAAAMFTGIAGLAPDQAGESDVQRTVAACERLPLGLRVAGARLRQHPTWTPGHLADRIARNGLAEMHSADRDVAGVFAMSVQALSSRARAAFLRVALHPAPEFSLTALAAALGDESPGAVSAEAAADELLACHLIEETGPGRYRMHALLREFGRQRAAEMLTAAERRAALVRILNYYWATGDAADRAVFPERRRPRERPAAPVDPEPFATAAAARRWFEGEYPAIEAAMTSAREGEFRANPKIRAFAVRLPLAIGGLSDTNGPWENAERHLAACIELCREDGDEERAALASFELSRVQRRLRHLDDAKTNAEAALTTWRRKGDITGEADARDLLGLMYKELARCSDALPEHEAALRLYRDTDDQHGCARALDHIGVCQTILGDYGAAESAFESALMLGRMTGDRRMEARIRLNSAVILMERGYCRDAEYTCEQSRVLFQELDDRGAMATASNNLGEIAMYGDAPDRALDHFTVARDLFGGLKDARSAVESRVGIGRAQLALGRVGDARETLEQAVAEAELFCEPALSSQIKVALGDVCFAQRRNSEARLHYRNACAEAENGVSAKHEQEARDRLGDLCMRDGLPAEAHAHWGRALALADALESPQKVAIKFKHDLIGQSSPIAL